MINKNEIIHGISINKVCAIIMISMLHFIGHGGALASSDLAISTVGYIIKSFCIIGVNLFLLSSGYLLCNREFKRGRIISIWLETIIYSWVIYFVMIIFSGKPSTAITIKSLLPVISIEYWYVTGYIILLFFSTFLNSSINNIGKRWAYRTIFVGLIVFCLLRMAFPQKGLLELGGMQGYGLIWMMFMYFIGGVLRLYPIKMYNRALLFAVYFFNSILVFLGNYLCRTNETFKNYDTFFDYSNLFVVISSCSFFLFVLALNNDKNSQLTRFITFVSKHTISAYIIQEQIAFKYVLWTSLCTMIMGYSCLMFYLFAIVIVVLFVVGCAALDYLRNLLMGKIGLSDYIDKNINRRKIL